MVTELTVKDVAALRGCSERAVRKQIASGKLKARSDDDYHYTRWLIPLESLPPADRRKYMRTQGIDIFIPPEPHEIIRKTRSFDEYTEKQRTEFIFWQKAVKE